MHQSFPDLLRLTHHELRILLHRQRPTLQTKIDPPQHQKCQKQNQPLKEREPMRVLRANEQYTGDVYFF